MEELEEIKKRYKLTNEEHDEIQQAILRIWFDDKFPVENPKAIIDIAPPASGKTGLNGFGKDQFFDNNVVIINSDEFKPFHPKVDEIARLYPQYFTKITDQESNTWTSTLFDEALKNGYNVIFEGTGRNARILETIKNKMQKYHVTVRGMAVNELNCLISILERYEFQVKAKGWGRLVTLDHFYETYNAMPQTIDEIEKSKVVDSVEVYKRGNIPSQPIKIYDSTEVEMGRFPNARFAVFGGREEDKKLASEYFIKNEAILLKLLENDFVSEEEKEILKQILVLAQKAKSNEMQKITYMYEKSIYSTCIF